MNEDVIEQIDYAVDGYRYDIWEAITRLGFIILPTAMHSDGAFLPLRDPSLRINGVIRLKTGQQKNAGLAAHEAGHGLTGGSGLERLDLKGILEMAPDDKDVLWEECHANLCGADLLLNTSEYVNYIGYNSPSRIRYTREKKYLEKVIEDYQQLVNYLRWGDISTSQKQRLREYQRDIPRMQENLEEARREFLECGYLTTAKDLAAALHTTEGFILCKHKVLREFRGYADLPDLELYSPLEAWKERPGKENW